MHRTTIAISTGLRDRLVSLGHKNESYDSIIKRLLKKESGSGAQTPSHSSSTPTGKAEPVPGG